MYFYKLFCYGQTYTGPCILFPQMLNLFKGLKYRSKFFFRYSNSRILYTNCYFPILLRRCYDDLTCISEFQCITDKVEKYLNNSVRISINKRCFLRYRIDQIYFLTHFQMLICFYNRFGYYLNIDRFSIQFDILML